MAVGDSTVVLQSINRMFDRLAAEKRERRQEALQMMQFGLQERKLSMMEEVRNLQMKQSKMQMAAYVVGDMQKQTNVQKAQVANSFLLESRFLDFYNPDDPDWAVKFREVLKGEYKEGYFGEEQGYNFSDKNASLISNALLQAQGSQDPQGILNLIDRANRAYLGVEGGGKISAEDANLLRGFTHMGMLNIGEDEKGDQVFEMSPTWQSLMTSTDNIFQNESKIARERAGIQKGDYDIQEELSFLQHESLPDVEQSLNEVDLQLLADRFIKKEGEGDLSDLTENQINKKNVDESIDLTSVRLDQLSDNLASKQGNLNMLKMNQDQFGYAIDQVELENLANEIRSIKDSISTLRPELQTLNQERELTAEKIFLEERNIPVTEENIRKSRELVEKQRREYATLSSQYEYMKRPQQ